MTPITGHYTATIEDIPYNSNCFDPKRVRVGTFRADEYLNLYVDDSGGTIHPDTARKLRDALNEIYPPEEPAKPAEISNWMRVRGVGGSPTTYVLRVKGGEFWQIGDRLRFVPDAETPTTADD